MEFFEKKNMSNILPSKALWFRYVDDILCLWPVAEKGYRFPTTLNEIFFPLNSQWNTKMTRVCLS